MRSSIQILQLTDLLAVLHGKLARPNMANQFVLDSPDYVPPLALHADAYVLLIAALEFVASCLRKGEKVIASVSYQDRRDPQDCCVVLHLQQLRDDHTEFCVDNAWLDRFGELRDRLLACSIGLMLQDSSHGMNVQLRLPVFQQNTRSLQHRNTILLVEDDDFVRASSLEVLESEGFLVEACRTAEEAESFVDRRVDCINLVISDLSLPGRDGRALAATVHRVAKNVPVLITSGYGTVVEEDPLRHTYFLSKPYNARALLAAARRCLQVFHFVAPVAATQDATETRINGFC